MYRSEACGTRVDGNADNDTNTLPKKYNWFPPILRGLWHYHRLFPQIFVIYKDLQRLIVINQNKEAALYLLQTYFTQISS